MSTDGIKYNNYTQTTVPETYPEGSFCPIDHNPCNNHREVELQIYYINKEIDNHRDRLTSIEKNQSVIQSQIQNLMSICLKIQSSSTKTEQFNYYIFYSICGAIAIFIIWQILKL